MIIGHERNGSGGGMIEAGVPFMKRQGGRRERWFGFVFVGWGDSGIVIFRKVVGNWKDFFIMIGVEG